MNGSETFNRRCPLMGNDSLTVGNFSLKSLCRIALLSRLCHLQLLSANDCLDDDIRAIEIDLQQSS